NAKLPNLRPNSVMKPGRGTCVESGWAKSNGGNCCTAPNIVSAQIFAGYVAPKTRPTRKLPPCIGVVSFNGSPIHTATVYCGVKPLNQASTSWSVVPVLPAAGRGKLPSD